MSGFWLDPPAPAPATPRQHCGPDLRCHPEEGGQHMTEILVGSAGHKALGISRLGKRDRERAVGERLNRGVAEQHPGNAPLALEGVQHVGPPGSESLGIGRRLRGRAPCRRGLRSRRLPVPAAGPRLPGLLPVPDAGMPRTVSRRLGPGGWVSRRLASLPAGRAAGSGRCRLPAGRVTGRGRLRSAVSSRSSRSSRSARLVVSPPAGQQHLRAHQLQQQPGRRRAAHLDEPGADDLSRPGQRCLTERGCLGGQSAPPGPLVRRSGRSHAASGTTDRTIRSRSRSSRSAANRRAS